MEALKRVAENNVLTIAIIGGVIYIYNFTDIGKVIYCILNPAKCLEDVVPDPADLAKKANDIVHNEPFEAAAKLGGYTPIDPKKAEKIVEIAEKFKEGAKNIPDVSKAYTKVAPWGTVVPAVGLWDRMKSDIDKVKGWFS